jgi:hypothetical protein
VVWCGVVWGGVGWGGVYGCFRDMHVGSKTLLVGSYFFLVWCVCVCVCVCVFLFLVWCVGMFVFWCGVLVFVQHSTEQQISEDTQSTEQ